jgi:urocanate reductase
MWMSKKTLPILAAVAALFVVLTSMGAPEVSTKGAWLDGTYVGKAQSHGGEMVVSVVVKDGKIQKVVPKATDTEGISDAALTKLPAAMVKAQSTEVDAVSGASETSEALKTAVKEALKNAWIDPVTSVVSTDVVVLGGGNAGLAAAVSASEKGAKVILLEKMAFLGGNSIRSGGAYNAADPERQKLINVEDSPQKHFEQTMAGGDNKADPALVRILTNNSLDGLHWLEGQGMKWNDKVFTVLGALWPRSHQPADATGTGFIKTLKASAEKKGVQILLETKATQLVQVNGRIVGVVATDADGKRVRYNASKGVVLATGGFGANKEMRQKYDPKITPNLGTTNSVGATGDGILLGQAINANLVGMEYIQMLPLGDPKTGVLEGWIGFDVENYIYINKLGKRFVSEAERRDVMTQALIKQPDQFMYVVCDAHSFPTPQDKNSFNETAEQLVKSGRDFTANTIEELATKMGVDPVAMKATIDRYNEGVKTKNDEFGKKLLKDPIDKAPFYASPRVPTVHHTMGGVQINTQAQVIGTDGQVIPGLYAAGEVTGGIHGSNRLGGNALADTIVFGRIAGTNVATLK